MTRVSSTDDRRSLWRHRDFMLFWVGETVSLFGSQVTVLALPLTAVLILRASPVELGLLNAAGFLPFLIATLPVGAWLDRRRRRPTLLAANLGRAVVIAVVPITALVGALRIELLYAVAFAHGILTVFYDVGWLSFVPSLVGREQMIGANSRLQASASAAQVGGPGVGGVLVQVLTAPMALVADAASFAFSGITLSLIRSREPEPSVRPGGSLWRDVIDGLRATFGDPVLRAMAMNAAAYNLFDQILFTVFLLYAVGPLGLSPGILGLVIAGGSLGGLLGAAVAAPAGARLGVGGAMIAASFVGGSTLFLIPFIGGPVITVGVLLAAVFFVQGLGIGVGNVHFVSLRQARTPDDLLGRMNASYRMVTYGAIPIGALLGGVLGQVAGLRPALLVAGIGLLLAPFIIVFSPVRGVRALPSKPQTG